MPRDNLPKPITLMIHFIMSNNIRKSISTDRVPGLDRTRVRSNLLRLLFLVRLCPLSHSFLQCPYSGFILLKTYLSESQEITSVPSFRCCNAFLLYFRLVMLFPFYRRGIWEQKPSFFLIYKSLMV